MCEYDTNLLKNERILTKPWRARIVILKKNEWVDIDLVGVLIFMKNLKKDEKKVEFNDYIAVYKDHLYQTTNDKGNSEVHIIRPKIEEKVLKKLNQGYKMNEGECLLYSMIDKRNNYTLISENFIEWRDRSIGEHIGIVFFNNMSCFETWKKISEVKKLKANIKKKDKILLMQNETYFKSFCKENILIIKDILEKHMKSFIEIVLSQDFLTQLSEIFRLCEENLDNEAINNINLLVELILKTGIEQVFNVFMSDCNYNWVFGVLEYSKDNICINRNFHRNTINMHTNYKNLYGALPEDTAKKIQWCYRQTYLLDCVFAADNEATFYFVLQRNIYNLQEEILNEILYNENVISKIFNRFYENWKDSIDFLIELISLIDSSIDVQKKRLYIEKLKNLDFLAFSTNFLSFLISWNNEYIEKQYWLLKFLKILRNFVIYDTFHFLQFMEKDLSKNVFLPLFANLFIFYGCEIQIEISEIWKIFIEDIAFSTVLYNPFIDFLSKCMFFESKTHIFELFFEELLNLIVICLQKNKKMIVFFLTNSTNFNILLEIAVIKDKKAWIIAILKVFKEMVLLNDEAIYIKLKEEMIKKCFYRIFIKYFTFKSNLIKSLFIELFHIIVKNKIQDILDPSIQSHKSFLKNPPATPEKMLYLENTSSNLNLSLHIDELDTPKKESIQETIIQLVIEEEEFPPKLMKNRLSLEEDFLE